jgi:PiT family inorganic phosphate transporter
MPQLALTPTQLLIGCALLYSFLNGIQDGANTVATVITSRALPPRWALVMVSIAEFLGPFIFGVAVARTIGAGTVAASALTLPVLIAALLAACAWNVITWRLGIPSSSSHALIGGLLGAVLASTRLDWGVLQAAGWVKVVAGLFAAPVVSILASFWVMHAIKFALRSATPRVNWFFKRGQLVTTLGLALSHGANDAPKSMGLVVMGLVAGGQLASFTVPTWVIASTAGAMALGTLLGGYRIIRTLGTRFYRVRPIHAFTSQVASGIMVLTASLTGLPVSTSQVVSASIAGVGAAERFNKVRWGVLREVLVAWLLTIPLTALAGALAYLLVR